MAGRRTETSVTSVCPCRYTLQETQKRETLLSPSRFPADHHACRFHAATPANVLRPVADRRVQSRTHSPVGERPTEGKRLRPRSWGGAVARKQDGGALRQTYSKGVCATHQVATYSERRRSLVTRISGG